MFKFPEGFYVDVRIEKVNESKIHYINGHQHDCRKRDYEAAFIRLFNGKKWFYSAVSEIEKIQEEMDKLVEISEPNRKIDENPIVKKIKTNKGKYLKFKENDITKISVEKKIDFLKNYFDVYESKDSVKMWNVNYSDKKVEKRIVSSKGSDLTFDFQLCGYSCNFNLSEGKKKFNERFTRAGNYFSELKADKKEMIDYLEKCIKFMRDAKNIEPGKYQVILSPIVAGVFAHESFGHKSEADFMVGDETMRKEWALGKKVGSDILSIIDDGNLMGSGYVPFDDEGTKAEKTYLIKNGVLSGRLHNTVTADSLNEDLTGNSRAIGFEYEPIVRMTTTYIDKGNKTKDELFKGMKDGIYIESLKHGSGMSTFTIAPTLAWRVEDGQITYPVNISIITGIGYWLPGQI